MPVLRTVPSLFFAICAFGGALAAQSGEAAPSFETLKAEGARRSRYLEAGAAATAGAPAVVADLETYRARIEPVLRTTCYSCHGPDEDEAGLRLDTLDPDLFAGNDVDWWLEVLGVLSNGEMPPPGEIAPEEAERWEAERGAVIEWLSQQSHAASQARRAGAEHSPYRRLARFEYNHALQDLLGLPFDFAGDLPPDPVGEDGFENSSATLHISGLQLRVYLDAARDALRLATVRGERPPELQWSLSMGDAAAREWEHQDRELEQLGKKHEGDPATLERELAAARAAQRRRPGGTHFRDPATGRMARQRWNYNGARFAWAPRGEPAAMPAPAPGSVAVVPPGQTLIVELGDRLPDRGTMRVRVRARGEGQVAPSLALVFGWQASNDSQANVPLDVPEHVVACGEALQVFEWNVPLSQVYPRNSVRGINKMGDLPSPSEFLKIQNAALPGGGAGDVVIDLVEVSAPVYAAWPPASHRRIFAPGGAAGEVGVGDDESAAARKVIEPFLARAWRSAPDDEDVMQKVALFESLRPSCETFEDAVLEVLATALASPRFLYVGGGGAAENGDENAPQRLDDRELATRLSLFLWCSIPDDELRALADAGRLADPAVLDAQVDRMLADPKAQRFAEQFVRQWLNLELLEFYQPDRKAHPRFDDELKASMRAEPVAFFGELLAADLSVLEFLHADFAMVDERLARHYGIAGVRGNRFRRVALDPGLHRGGLLTQAGLLAMNSDGIDSHPLKRGVWLLERLLHDPPPPPPPAVPEIDLADPRIAQMTLKERIEDHRNHAACMSCHAKIDPWGIAFENYDAVGAWRTEIGGRPVDARSVLFNGQVLDGMEGLERFLLEHRQDQFVAALVAKLATFALGRPLGFGDRAALDEIVGEVRRRGDGLATIVRAIATSSLFATR